nr:hypothetical protein [Tanacetum cinerariifolium]
TEPAPPESGERQHAADLSRLATEGEGLSGTGDAHLLPDQHRRQHGAEHGQDHAQDPRCVHRRAP